jgi:hypothetical protein
MLEDFQFSPFGNFGVAGNLVFSPADHQIHFAAPVCAGEPSSGVLVC